MRVLILGVCWLLALGPGAAGAQTPPADATQEKTRYIIGFKAGTDAASREGILKKFDLVDLEEEGLEALNAKVVAARDEKVRPSAFTLMSDPGVYYVEEDFYAHWLVGEAASLQQVPVPAVQAVVEGLPKLERKDATQDEIPWGIARVHAPDAWGTSQGAGVKVAVVDTGIDCKHPDLAANCAGGYNAFDSKKEPIDDNNHGTHVAGTIAAVKDGKGVVGVAPQARLYAVKVLDAEGGGRLTTIIKGLVWCGRNGMQVANMSLGTPSPSFFMHLGIMYAKSKGVAIVAAAGNDKGAVNYPAAYKETIAVSAMDSNDAIAGFSSRGKQVEFIAPGVGVKSTVPGGGYDRYSGTSMATPHVAGLAVLAVSQGARGVDGVRGMLKAAAKPLTGLKPEEQGAGVVDAGLLKKK